MKVRKLNLILVMMTIIAGFIGALTGEFLLDAYYGEFPNSLLVGLYIGQLSLWIGMFAWIAERWSPRLNGNRWAQQYAGFSLKLLVPVMLIIPFVLATLLQFIYELDALDMKPPQDIVLIVDVSESMLETDPQNHTISAVKEFLQKMKPSQRSAIFIFNHEAQMVQPFTYLKTNDEKAGAGDKFEESITFNGGTDIENSLSEAMSYLNSEKQNSRTMVILLSDGFSEMNIERAVEPFQDKRIVINTVGLSKEKYAGAELLSAISKGTGGSYYSVKDTDKLSEAFHNIQKNTQDRLLIGERLGISEYLILYKVLRVLFIAIIGAAIGAALGLLFDNRFLAVSFGTGGLTAGILAGMLLEYGFSHVFYDSFSIRLVSDIVLAVIISLFSVVVPYKVFTHLSGQAGREVTLYRTNSFSKNSESSSNKSFH
jgi:Ca-activated chloride channel homolog